VISSVGGLDDTVGASGVPSGDVNNLSKISQNGREPTDYRKQTPFRRLGTPQPDRHYQGTEPVMKIARTDDSLELLDRKSSRSICDAVGERLQRVLRPDSGMSSHLQHLVDELRRRDETA
jgi:hypothetical protein